MAMLKKRMSRKPKINLIEVLFKKPIEVIIT